MFNYENDNIDFNYDNDIISDTTVINKEDKYGNDLTYESFADINIFFPIATKLIDPLRNIGLTPNGVTYISTFFTLLSIYFIYLNKYPLAGLSYGLGYLLDCVDGKMARKYNMGTSFGMALDLVSDNISNLILISYLYFVKYDKIKLWLIPIVIMTIMISLSYGLNEAILSVKTTGNDNFYLKRVNELKNETNPLYKIFLFITETSYRTYKLFFPTYNEEKINKWLHILKHFGPGNYCLFIIFIILYIQ
jgi:hypothetical protein